MSKAGSWIVFIVVDYSIFVYCLNIVFMGKPMINTILTLQDTAEYLIFFKREGGMLLVS